MPEWLLKLFGLMKADTSGAEISLRWQILPPMWFLFLVILPSIAIFAWMVYRLERNTISRRGKIALSIIRVLIILIVLTVIMEPSLTIEHFLTKKSYIAVLADESASMSINDKVIDKNQRRNIANICNVSESEVPNMRRIDIVNKVLQNKDINLISNLNEKLNVQFYTFASNIRSGAEPGKIEPIGNLTAIGDSLIGALNVLRNQYLAAVILFSDGRNNYGRDPIEVARIFASRHIPIYTVCPGIPQTPKDAEICELEAPEAVMVNDVAEIGFKVKSFGFKGEKGELTLTEIPYEKETSQDPKDIQSRISRGKKISEQEIALTDTTQKASFSYKPDVLGNFELIVSLAPKEGEATIANNFLTHKIKVADDKIRVLFVDSEPRWEYRYLKNALVRDTSIQVQCLLLSADYDFPQEGTPGLELLKEFPGLLDEIVKYDVIIIGDVDPKDLTSTSATHDTVASNLEKFVSEFGGGLILISGVRNNPFSFSGPFTNLLPIVVDEASSRPSEGEGQSDYKYSITDEGKLHPITNLLHDQNLMQNQDFWEDKGAKGSGLPSIRWFIKSKRTKPGAITLVNTVASISGEKNPLFVLQPYGRGRVFFSATDETWLWRRGVDNLYFYTFWRQVISWARQGKLLGSKRFRISTDKKEFAIGEQVQIFATAYSKTFQPIEEKDIDCYIESPEGERIAIKLPANKSKAGTFTGTYIPSQTGLYKIWIGDADNEQDRASARFAVLVPNREFADYILDPVTLQKISDISTGGDKALKAAYMINEVGELAENIKPSDLLLSETSEIDLWDKPFIFILFVLLITAEWITRKFYSLL